MNWISEEAEKLAWYMEAENIDYKFPAVDDLCGSYFEDYDMGENILEEYEFSTMPELQKLLQKKRVIHSLDIDRVCAVAAFKNRPDIDVGKSEEHMLPTFIYNF